MDYADSLAAQNTKDCRVDTSSFIKSIRCCGNMDQCGKINEENTWLFQGPTDASSEVSFT